MRVLVHIPARAGSKGLPGKNLSLVGGMSLLAKAVYVGRQFVRRSGLRDALLIVDTDSEALAAEGRRWGADAPFLRPAELAADVASTVDTALYTLDRVESTHGRVDALVLLQPTSPLRTAEDICRCWEAFHPDAQPSVLSVAEWPHPIEFALGMDDGGTLRWALGDPPNTSRRQGFPARYAPTGSVYITTPTFLRKYGTFLVPGLSRGVIMPRARSVDVDTEADLTLTRALIATPTAEPFVVAGRLIGPGAPCFLIGEAGVNHNGDVGLAHRLIDAAADAKVDAVKFQTFDPDRVVTRDAPKAPYQEARSADNESQYEMLRRLILPRSAHEELQRHAAERKLLFLSTAFDEESADFLDALGVPAFKVPSGELTNHPFLTRLARKQKPLFISTGMSTLEEVADAVEVVRANGGTGFALLHCVTTYPASGADSNLRAMATMASSFGVPVGWSDHTPGSSISCAAAALGAAVIEKHFTLDRALPGPDHRASLEPSELGDLVESVRLIESSLGDGIKQPTAGEIELARVVKRSLRAAADLPAGHAIEEADLTALRPGGGLSPAHRARLLGRTLRVPLKKGQIIGESDVV